MNFFRFIKWRWNKTGEAGKVLTCFFSWIFAAFLGSFYLGFQLAFIIFLCGLLLFVLGIFLCGIYQSIKSQWIIFQEERDAEAQLIVDKLAGKSMDRYSAEYMIDKIKSRRNKAV